MIEITRKWTDEDWLDRLIQPGMDEDAVSLLPVTACRALGDLKAEAAIGPLIDLLCEADEDSDEWLPEELPHFFGKIGEASFERLLQLATDRDRTELVRSTATYGLGKIAEYHPETRGHVVSCLVTMMTNAANDHIDFNSTVMEVLVELKPDGAAEPIERAFAGNYIDTARLGTWSSVRHLLGVEGLGLTMPATPYNSYAELDPDFRVGIFSLRPVFVDGDVDEDGEIDYYDCADAAFASSSEGQQVLDRDGRLGWYRSLLDFGIHYRGETVDEMTTGAVQEFVLDYVPRKVTTGPESAKEIVGELLAFWEFLDRAYKLPEATSIVEWLKTKGLAKELKEALSDDSNFGMAKALFSMGHDAGFDMTSEAGLNSFMQVYNSALSAQNTPPRPVIGQSPITRDVRVGRNDPCPCGSGKKFKKCCARSD